MYAPGTRRHIKAALDLGAEIMEVLKFCVVQGVQACNLCLTKSSASERSTSDKQLDRSGTSLRQFPPSRLVCLTEETVETLYLLDEQDLIVGVSGYAVRPPQVRREKPRVSAFTSADIPKILALEPVQLYTLPPRFIFVRWQPQRLLASMGQPPSVGHTAMQQCLHIPRRL
jgi:ABC-type Fe3+-hydroxamate transport system substrate-binding protein